MYFQELKDNYNWTKLKLKQLNKAFFQDFVEDFDKITTLSKIDRAFLKETYKISSVELVKMFSDETSGTYKALFKLEDGKLIESVLMMFTDGRNSVCVSSQVGCPVGCIFCASGRMGFDRNLTYKEIVDQVLYWSRWLKAKKDSLRVSNIVYMGMGEPMLNYYNTVQSVKILTNEEEFALGDRHISVSSSGYVKQLRAYMEEGLKTRLAISLHAPNQELREKLMPVAKIYSLTELFDFIKDWERYTNKRVSYEYTMIDNVNDTSKHAWELSKLLQGRLAHVNLIPMNPIAERVDLQKSSRNSIFQFASILEKSKIPVTIRITMGDKIQAACGQLANKNK
ncbi:MAG: 23S rRNA (adenine(2503)-C(2))-methyltransferase RlmN [bacterium]